MILQAKEAARLTGWRGYLPAATIGNRRSRRGLPIRHAHQVGRKFEPEPSGRVRPGNNGIGISGCDLERNATARFALTPVAPQNGQGQEQGLLSVSEN